MKVFSIVESPIIGDPLAPLRMQAGEAAPSMDLRNLLHYHITKNITQDLGTVHDQNEDHTSTLSDDFLADMTNEVESIMGNLPEGTQVYYVNSPEELADLLDKFNIG